jgi:HTH-type transcriptional regulator / antitoxin HipB
MSTHHVRSPEDLGDVIADRRAVRQLSQAELAEQVGISRSYLAKIERGRTTSVVEHTFRLLRRLGATVTITFDDEP